MRPLLVVRTSTLLFFYQIETKRFHIRHTGAGSVIHQILGHWGRSSDEILPPASILILRGDLFLEKAHRAGCYEVETVATFVLPVMEVKEAVKYFGFCLGGCDKEEACGHFGVGVVLECWVFDECGDDDDDDR